MRDLLEWLMGCDCGQANPSMAAHEQKAQESSYSVHEAECLNWYSVYTRILKK